uniref:Methyltranfer_dom domain-containing protein n=1 Tax=Caenorhabditis japonica TaxID=281687 RepID=A0A8R1EF23_CAEJA
MNRGEFLTILEEYGNVTSTRSIEHFALGTPKSLDGSWKDYLENSSLEEVIALITDDKIGASVPDSLKSLKFRLKALEYSRKCVRTPVELWNGWTGENREYGLDSKFKLITSTNGLIRKRIKAKKQHEIDRIVELISQIQMFFREKSEPIDSLVDIGAGVGHLSRMISLKNGLNVMAVEGNQQFTLAANSLDEQLVQKTAAKMRHFSSDLNFEKSPLRSTNFVTEELASKIDDFAENRAILVGLHCCGDFSSTILKVFQKSEKAKALVLLGCCYHKQFQCFHFLHPDGFNLEKTDISRFARAHLEKWIREISDNPEDWNLGLCSVKCEDEKTTFEDYIRRAMAKRGRYLIERVLE